MITPRDVATFIVVCLACFTLGQIIALWAETAGDRARRRTSRR